MADVLRASLLCWILLSSSLLVSASQDQEITAKPGETKTLTCRAPNNNIIYVVEWTRPDLEESEYVLFYRAGRFFPENQHQGFKNRVELKDKQMKDGDVSLILKNVTSDDTGTYECRIVQIGTNRRKRAIIDEKPISSISLRVRDSGDAADNGGHVGLAVGVLVVGLLLMVLVVVGVSLVIYKRKASKKSDAYKTVEGAFELQPL